MRDQGCLQRTIPSGQKPMEAEWNRATIGTEIKSMKDSQEKADILTRDGCRHLS